MGTAMMFSLLFFGADFTICDNDSVQFFPAVAYQNSQNYVFWTDYRASPIYALYGARVSTTGTVIDPDGKALVSDSVFNPRPGYDGANFLVVWREGCWSKGDIRGVRVTPDCDAMGAPFYISQANNTQLSPEIAFGGGSYLVVWADSRTSNLTYVIYCARVSPSGAVLDPQGIQIGTSGLSSQSAPNVVYAGDKFFTVWGYTSGGRLITGVLGRFIQTSGSLSDTIRIVNASSDVYSVRTAYSGTNMLVIWTDFSGQNYCVKGQMLSTDGTLIGSPFVIAPTAGSPSLALCFDGTNYFAAYCNAADFAVWGVKISVSGSLVGQPFRVSGSGNSQDYFDVTPSANNRYFSVWTEYDISDYDILGNLDVPITDVAEQLPSGFSRNRLRSSIVHDAVILENAQDREAAIFDASGVKIGTTRRGHYDCRHLQKGVYFIRMSTGESFKVIKI